MKIFFSATSGFYGEGIRRFEGGDFNHTGFILPNGEIIETTAELGVHKRANIDCVVKRSIAVVQYNILIPNEEAGLAFLNAQIGKKYDKLAIFGILLQRDWEDDSQWYCSELLAAWYKAVGLAIPSCEKNGRVGVRLTHAYTHAMQHGQAVVLK